MLRIVLHHDPAAEMPEELIKLESVIRADGKEIRHPSRGRQARIAAELAAGLVVENCPSPGHCSEWLNRRPREVLAIGRIGILNKGRTEQRSSRQLGPHFVHDHSLRRD